MHTVVYIIKLWFVSLLLQCFFHESEGQFLEFNGKEYKIEKNGYVRLYSQAEQRCANQDSTLAIVDSENIAQFLVEQIGNITAPPFSFYLGLRRMNNSRATFPFQWSDGTPLSWSNWKLGEPNNSPVSGRSGGENCVIMGWSFALDSSFQWRDVRCDFTSRFICERTIRSRTRPESGTEPGVTTTQQNAITSTSTLTATTSTTVTTSTTSGSTTLPIPTISSTQKEIIIYAAIGGGALLIAIIIIIIVSVCHNRKKKNHKSKPHDPNAIYETIEESSYGSRQPVYNEIYKSSDYNNGGYMVPTRHGTNTYSQIYMRPDGSLYQDHTEPPPIPSTLPKRERKSSNKRSTNI